MRFNYVCKKIFDVDGNLSGYDVRYLTTSGVKPAGDFEILEGDAYYPHRKAELVLGGERDEWRVVEDTVKKLAAESKNIKRTDRRTELNKIAAFMKAIDDNFTAQQATVLKTGFRAIIEELVDK